MSLANVRAFIDQAPRAPAQKKLCKDRLSAPDKAYVAATGPALGMRKRLEAGEAIVLENVPTARFVGLAVQGAASTSQHRPDLAAVNAAAMP